ncbi:MAG: regulator of sirC expression with transglutaminase-like and TPR domain [Flavobacteriales bacterium]|jgi:regulator of sirC expression with transglutaminase-like and TPR domain
METDEKEIKALINLIDDPDVLIYQQIRERLIELGEPIISSLENVWEFNTHGVIFQDRIEDIVHQIQFKQIKRDLTAWVQEGATDLLQGVLIINRYQYPDLDTDAVIHQIKSISRQVWIELNENLTALEKVRIINHVIFNTLGFKGNKKKYHSPNNSYLSSVLETKKGNPLSLSILYMLIANQLEEPIFGINLPHHFLLAYIDNHNIAQLVNDYDSDVLFYINCFGGGSILHRKEIEDFLNRIDVPHNQQYFESCTPLDMAVRMLNNLIQAYSNEGLSDKKTELKQLLSLLSN